MNFPPTTLAQWRALVDKDLAGKPFDKVLVHEVLSGVSVAPLYVEAPAPDPAARYERHEPFRICMRHLPGANEPELAADVAGGADALWVPLDLAFSGALSPKERIDGDARAVGEGRTGSTSLVLEASEVPAPEVATQLAKALASARVTVGVDPIAWRAEGRAPMSSLRSDLDELGRFVQLAVRQQGLRGAVVSTLPYHEAGADAADELAIALSTGARYVEALLGAGLSPDEALDAIALRVAVGRDTFAELAKLRALRTCWEKLLVAFGATRGSGPERPLVHAVCSRSTLAVRDPWVNMLRVTTQVFAAVVGGADLVTPNAYDELFESPSPLGHRIARNTGLVLREESALGKVSDAAGGSYYFDSLTDALAREAWKRFRELSREGGVVEALESGRLATRLDTAWKQRLDRIAKRKHPVLGVSEFANLDEKLPGPAPSGEPAPKAGALPAHRDAAPFEALRLRAEALNPPPQALLLTLGSFAESRPRAGFASAFFAAGGIRTRESTADERAVVACLCGTDERYAEEAARRVRSLKALGVSKVLLAGRPGALEGELREAGIDGYLFVGCD
ncbi:MAG TPA: methylmalonyl-CoA mutase family protein, partial [Labilithrix sp.]|nr:methylmalonyl-CoA mutase family protein [Labilithrix sp.]